MNTWRARRTGAITLAVLAAIATSAACGGGAASDTPASPASTSASAPAPSSASGGAAAPAAAAPATGAAASGGGDPLLARGKVIFEKEAGGVGCAACHGMDGKGNGPAGVAAPPNRGLDIDRVRTALANVELMKIVKLNDADLEAVVAYLAYLGKQP
ncbi:MAG: cytochrome c [Dehalococcoidia bacterium]